MDLKTCDLDTFPTLAYLPRADRARSPEAPRATPLRAGQFACLPLASLPSTAGGSDVGARTSWLGWALLCAVAAGLLGFAWAREAPPTRAPEVAAMFSTSRAPTLPDPPTLSPQLPISAPPNELAIDLPVIAVTRPEPRAKPALPHGDRGAAIGHLAVRAIPWAKVSVDGHPCGETPLSPLDLVEGAHRVELRFSDRVVRTTALIRRGETSLIDESSTVEGD